MSLVRRSEKQTNFQLPVLVNGYKCYWYYDNEYLLYKAYRQLKAMNSNKIIPSYPIIYV